MARAAGGQDRQWKVLFIDGLMKISIVMPVFNDVRIARALESVLSQQHGSQLEIIVVDAASTDGTRDVIAAFRDRISRLISEPDAGIYDGMNKGIRHATGEVIGILNADDRYHDPLVIRDVAGVFCGDESIDACYGDIVYINESGRLVRYWKAGIYRKSGWRLGWMPPHPTFFVRRRVYERYGAFDLQYPIAADYELMLRLLLKHEIKVRYLGRIMLDMAPGGNSTRSIGSIVKANLEVRRACRKHGLRGMLLAPILKPGRKVFQLANRP